MRGKSLGVGAAFVIAAGLGIWVTAQEYKSGIIWPEPKIVDPGTTDAAPPSDAVVLFDGKDLSAWKNGEKWEIKDGYAIARKGGISTKKSFGDVQLHLEFASPEVVKGKGQGRGNSGVYFMGRYEVQILDSYKNKTYFDGQCGAIYKQKPPEVNASRGPGQWQTYDIIFIAPRFKKDGSVMSPAYITAFHNGVLIHNHFELEGRTSYTEPASYKKHADKLPINLQFHGNPVRFRNIWLRELKPIKPTGRTTPTKGGKPYKPKAPKKTNAASKPRLLSIDELKKQHPKAAEVPAKTRKPGMAFWNLGEHYVSVKGKIARIQLTHTLKIAAAINDGKLTPKDIQKALRDLKMKLKPLPAGHVYVFDGKRSDILVYRIEPAK